METGDRRQKMETGDEDRRQEMETGDRRWRLKTEVMRQETGDRR